MYVLKLLTDMQCLDNKIACKGWNLEVMYRHANVNRLFRVPSSLRTKWLETERELLVGTPTFYRLWQLVTGLSL